MEEHHDELDLKNRRKQRVRIISLKMLLFCIYIYNIITYHLDYSQVFLPPQVFLHLWSNGGQHVVRVHNDVYKCVEETEERAVAT